MIRDTLIQFGLSKDCISDCAGTGLVVNIWGTKSSLSAERVSTVNSVALRADMDALPMKENNPGLYYKSTTDFAHMCGHDGHMATILTTA